VIICWTRACSVEYARQIDPQTAPLRRFVCSNGSRIVTALVHHDVEPPVTLDRGAISASTSSQRPTFGLLKERRAARSGNDIERRVPAFDGLLGDICNDDTRPSLAKLMAIARPMPNSHL